MNVRCATREDEPAWDQLVLSRPEGSAYHLFGWKKAVETAYGFSCPYLLAEDHGRIRGVLPLVHLRTPLGRGQLVSLPYCDVGGPLGDGGDVERILAQEARELAAGRGATLELRSATPMDGLAPSPRKVRMVMELPGNAEVLMAAFPAKLRSQVRKPEKDGLTVRLGRAELIDDFYRVFAENMRDLGSPVHSRAWVEAVVRGYEDRVRVGVVYLSGGVAAAAGIVLCHDRMVSIPWASSLRRHNRDNPNMLLYWGFLRFAADGGYSWFDFGRSTPGEGTYRFKEQWGAKPTPLYWTAAGSGQDSASSPLRKLGEEVFRRLPVSWANRIGPRVRRYVSL